jgi:hypothetical protein
VTQSYEAAQAYVVALSGDPTAIFDWRAIHDQRKDIPAIPLRGTLSEVWQSLVGYNAQGYGIFATPSALDGVGRKLENVAYLRAHYIDLDEADAEQQYTAASGAQPAPWFAVQSSAGKYHVYWPVQPYQGNDRFELAQRKLRQVFNGDRTIIDPTRVMRVPGFYHCKGEPQLVTCWALAGYGTPLAVEALEAALSAVNVIDGGSGGRHELGDPALAAPSLDWVKRALELSDPNAMDRAEWIAFTSAVKQAAWTLTDPDTLFNLWSDWCARYELNDAGENLKQWNSIRETEVGWASLVRRTPSLQAIMSFGEGKPKVQQAAPPPMPEPAPLDCSGEYLTHLEQQEWFKDCTFVVNLGLILDKSSRFLNSTKFNAKYGGKKFIIDGNGKTTNEPWQAATRSTLWTIPKVDHIRFLPSKPYGVTISDDLGRTGVNTYRPAVIERVPGDVTPFLNHIAALLPDATDRRILLDYLAHNIKYPGHKIPWAFVIQSAEGAGKGVIKRIITHCVGASYVYFPNAKELTDSGSQFNAWMRNKLFILADEIKVDDRRDLIEVLKPMISETRIEVQSKGVDQELEDNYANWGFFTNYKDAVPVSKNGRRYAIFFSPLQRMEDLTTRGMGEAYFNALYRWLDEGGCAAVADWFMSYPIERGAVSMRAPQTSSWQEALVVSRSPLERVIYEGIEDNIMGFRGGWISSIAVNKRAKETGYLTRTPTLQGIAACLEGMGYVNCGRSAKPYLQEDLNQRATLFYYGGFAPVDGYEQAQGY